MAEHRTSTPTASGPAPAPPAQPARSGDDCDTVMDSLKEEIEIATKNFDTSMEDLKKTMTPSADDKKKASIRNIFCSISGEYLGTARAFRAGEASGERTDRDIPFLAQMIGIVLGTLSVAVFFGSLSPTPLQIVVAVGLAIVFVAILLLLSTIEPELDNASFLIAMGVLGIGMGLIASQLGNVVQSAVGDADRSEAGGLQYTAQQLGSSLGTAFLGAVVITGLIAAFTANVRADERISDEVSGALEVQLSTGGSFVSSEEVRTGSEAAGLDAPTTDALVENYEDAQLKALKTAFLFAAFLTLGAFWTTRRLPTQRFDEMQGGSDPPDLAPESVPA